MSTAVLPRPAAPPSRAASVVPCAGARLLLLPSGRPAGRTRAAAGAVLRLARGLEPGRAVVLDFVLGDDPDRPLAVEMTYDRAGCSAASSSDAGATFDISNESRTKDDATSGRSARHAGFESAGLDRISNHAGSHVRRSPAEGASRSGLGARALRTAAALALPGLEPVSAMPAEPTAEALGCETRLRPSPATPPEFAAALRIRSSDARPGPDAVAESSSHRVALAHPAAVPARLADGLHLLAGLDACAALRLRCLPVRLEAADLRSLALAHRTLDRALEEIPLLLQERMAVAGGVARLEAWITAGAGVTVELSVLMPGAPEPWLLGSLGEALFGAFTEDTRRFETDLTLAAPDGAPPPFVLPSAGALSALSRLRADRLRKGRRAAIAKGAPIGTTDADCLVRLPDEVRAQGLYVTGATGTGKTTLLANLVRRDLREGRGVCVVDPHGDLFAELLEGLDARTRRRAMFVDLSDEAGGFSLNLLEPEGRAPARHRNFVCNQLIGAFGRIYRGCPESMGPMFEAYFRNALLLLMEAEGERATLLDLDRVFVDANWRREALERCEDESVTRFWRGIALKAGGEASLENIAPYIVSKLTQFTGNPALRPVLYQTRSTLDFEKAMAEGRPCLVNLAKGAVGEADAALMGALVTTKLFGAAMHRSEIPRARRRPFRVYLDEFQGYATDLLGSMLAEGRKFGLEPTLANQSLSQIDGRNRRDDIAHAVLANCASIVAFRSGPVDAMLLASWLGTEVAPRELNELPNRRAIARLGDPSGPPRLERIRTLPSP